MSRRQRTSPIEGASPTISGGTRLRPVVRRPVVLANLEDVESQIIENIIEANSRGDDPRVIGELCEIGRISMTPYTRERIAAEQLVEVTKEQDPDPDDPTTLPGSLYDPKMGRSSFSRTCAKCNEGFFCPSHCGWIDLGRGPDDEGGYVPPFIGYGFGPVIKSIVNITCRGCGEPLFTPEELIEWGLEKTKLDVRVRRIEENLPSQALYCPKIAGSARREEDGTEGTKGARIKKGQVLRVTCGQPNIPLKYDRVNHNIVHGDTIVSTTDIMGVLSLISPSSAKLYGFKGLRPIDLLWSFVIVVPPSQRETILAAEGKRQDYLAQEYRAILKRKYEIRAIQRGTNPDTAKIDKLVREIHTRIRQIYSSGKKKGRGAGRGNMQETKGIKEEISGKEGIVRNKLMGKRLNLTARGVIIPDPDLPFLYISPPNELMRNQFFVIPITSWNIKILQRRLEAGNLVHYIPKKFRQFRQSWDIKRRENRIKLGIGAEVTRPLEGGEWVDFGRNPSIHSRSLMSVLVTPLTNNSSSIKMHPSYDTPYNADHDGDEMHLKFHNDLMARSECAHVSNIIYCIMNGENSGACMGAIMDIITAIYLLTSPEHNGYFIFTKQQLKKLYALLTWKKELETLDNRLRKYNINKRSGRGLISALLPATFNYDVTSKDGNKVVIREGILLAGFLTKDHIGPVRGSFIQILYHNYSPFRSAYFITDITNIANYFLTDIRGFTVGIADVERNNPIVYALASSSLVRTFDVVQNIDKPTPDLQEGRRREGEVVSYIQSEGESLAISQTRKTLAGPNSFGNMARGKAKGDSFHLKQMIARGAGMGQQFYLGGRIEKAMTNRTRSDHYSVVNDTRPESRGYARQTLTEGLNLQSSVAHHIATRATLIDTSTKTADAGESHHLFNAALKDKVAEYDGSTRHVNRDVIQYATNYTLIDPLHSIMQPYAPGSKRKVEFYVDIDFWWNMALAAVENDLDLDEAYLYSLPI